jgi:thiol-disulfide isomerase/thioredoxin
MSRGVDRPRSVSAALLLGLLLLPALPSCGRGSAGDDVPASTVTRSGRDDPYAKLSLLDPQGRTIRLSEFKGKVRLIDVWATWCGPCRMIIPHLNSLYGRYRGQGLVVIGVAVDSTPEEVMEFTRTVPLDYPTGMMNRDLTELLGRTSAIPTSYLVDRNGRLRRKFIGYVEPETIEREVQKFLE